MFPVEIPDARFRAHETRTRELFAAVPRSPDIPNAAVVQRIQRERSHLQERLDDDLEGDTPRERLGEWRYRRSDAAEVWGAYHAATNAYAAGDFHARYDRLRAAYTAFEGAWDYRGSEPASALVVHRHLEELVSRGTDAVLSTGPYPSDPPAAVFEAGRMVRAHERAEATLEDARAIRTHFLATQSDHRPWRLPFAHAMTALDETRVERPPDRYERALEEGPSALDVDLEHGPAAAAFEQARRAATFDREVRAARDQHDPATGVLAAAHTRRARRAFRTTADAITRGTVDWPADLASIRALRDETVDALTTAWTTTPRPLGVALTRHPLGLLTEFSQYYHDRDVDAHDLARYVGTLHYARHYLDGVPAHVDTVSDAITTK